MKAPKVISIGSAHWDTIARAQATMAVGSDVPGRTSRQIGGVALNVARALAERSVDVAMLSAVGNDVEGDALLAAATKSGVNCNFVTRGDFATDHYLAIERPDGELHGAVADCSTLERLGHEILAPLCDDRLAGLAKPFGGTVIIDGNLTVEALESFVDLPTGKTNSCYFIAASPSKAVRLKSPLKVIGGTLFANKAEAGILCGQAFADSAEAALAIRSFGANAIITDGARSATFAGPGQVFTCTPPNVVVTSVTGAGDAFLAGFISAELAGLPNEDCLNAAAQTAAHHISQEQTP